MPIAIGRKNWLFMVRCAPRRAAAIASLIQSARLNGHEPAYLKDVLTGLPTQPQKSDRELLPHRWRPEST